MKKITFLIFLGLTLAGYGQQADLVAQTPDLLTAQSTKKAATDPDKNTGDMNAKWAKFVSGFANLFGSSGNSLTANASLYLLMHLDAAKSVDYSTYRKLVFARNLQFNLGVTPDNKNQFQIDSGSIGFKYTILNNTTASPRDYRRVEYLLNSHDAIFQYIISHTPDMSIQQKFGADGKYDENDLQNPDLVKTVKKQFHIKGTLHDALSPEGIKNALDYQLKIKPLWTFGLNENYGFQSRQTNTLTLSTEFSYFLHFFRKKKGDTLFVPLDLSMTYAWQADTSQKVASSDQHGDLSRHIFSLNFGRNITFGKADRFELKPSVTYVHIEGPLYSKESKDSFKANLTPRLKINSQLWLPVTISWDPKNGQIFGFLSVQYSFSS